MWLRHRLAAARADSLAVRLLLDDVPHVRLRGHAGELRRHLDGAVRVRMPRRRSLRHGLPATLSANRLQPSPEQLPGVPSLRILREPRSYGRQLHERPSNLP